MLRIVTRKEISALIMARYYGTLYQVQHDHKMKEFSLGEGSEKAVLQYKELKPSLIELEHTIVPESLQGKGLGKLLADTVVCAGPSTNCMEYAAFEYAIDKNLKVKVTCGFIQKYLEKYPRSEFDNILSE